MDFCAKVIPDYQERLQDCKIALVVKKREKLVLIITCFTSDYKNIGINVWYYR